MNYILDLSLHEISVHYLGHTNIVVDNEFNEIENLFI